MRHRWSIPQDSAAVIDRLASALKVSRVLAQCLVNRGLHEPETAAAFLAPKLKSLAEPTQIPNVVPAVERLIRARLHREPVVIFGDYDVDGVTATALLLEVMRGLGWRVDFYLPRRLEEGYGLSREAVDNCLAGSPARLLVAVDCGSTATATITELQSRGIEVVVVDHHQVANPAPPAVALVNPQLGPRTAGSGHELCSVGLAFKLAHALVRRARELNWPGAAGFDLRPLLDLVALGTIADLVPVTGENRILVHAGLERLARFERVGLRALAKVAQVGERVGSYEVGFQLGPRLNAAGRLESAGESLELLLTRDPARAAALADSLDRQNRERQQIERNIAEQLVRSLRTRFNPDQDYVIVEGELVWHVGVVGIVASRVLHEFYRPTVILGGDGYEWRGSGRSIEGFDLAAALRECSDLLVQHGGHAMAAGVTIDPKNLAAFRTRLNRLARAQLTPEQLRPVLRLDGRVALAELTLDRLRELSQLAPTGQGNPVVQVVVEGLTLKRPPQRIGRDQQHLKLWVTDGNETVEAVWWGGAAQEAPDGRFDLACAPQINEFNGRAVVQLRVLDWRPA